MAETPTRRMPAAPKAVWDDEIERLYRSWHRRVAAAESGHRVMADRLRRRSLLIGVPVVILTTLVGTGVFASLDEDSVPIEARVAVGTISILAALLSSLQTFMKYSTRAEGHRIAAMRYESLRRDMSRDLALPRQARGDPTRQLDSVAQRMDRYAKESPTIGEREWNRLMGEFQLSRVPPDPAEADAATVVIPDA
jgi:hypothetical protein